MCTLPTEAGRGEESPAIRTQDMCTLPTEAGRGEESPAIRTQTESDILLPSLPTIEGSLDRCLSTLHI